MAAADGGGKSICNRPAFPTVHLGGMFYDSACCDLETAATSNSKTPTRLFAACPRESSLRVGPAASSTPVCPALLGMRCLPGLNLGSESQKNSTPAAPRRQRRPRETQTGWHLFPSIGCVMSVRCTELPWMFAVPAAYTSAPSGDHNSGRQRRCALHSAHPPSNRLLVCRMRTVVRSGHLREPWRSPCRGCQLSQLHCWVVPAAPGQLEPLDGHHLLHCNPCLGQRPAPPIPAARTGVMQDAILRDAVEKYGAGSWKQIGAPPLAAPRPACQQQRPGSPAILPACLHLWVGPTHSSPAPYRPFLCSRLGRGLPRTLQLLPPCAAPWCACSQAAEAPHRHAVHVQMAESAGPCSAQGPLDQGGEAAST